MFFDFKRNKTDEAGPNQMGNSTCRTSGDQKNEQQEINDKRNPQEENAVDKFHEHDSKYPKQHDELENRQSTGEARMTKRQLARACGSKRYDPKCGACRRLRALARLQKCDLRPRCQSGDRKRDSKARRPARSHKAALTVPRVGSGVCKKCREKRGQGPLRIACSSDLMCYVVKGMKVDKDLEALEEKENEGSKKESPKERKKSDTSLRSDRSCGSSFHSFDSMNDEPMV